MPKHAYREGNLRSEDQEVKINFMIVVVVEFPEQILPSKIRKPGILPFVCVGRRMQDND